MLRPAITEDDYEELRRDYLELKMTQDEIATKFKTSRQTVSRVLRTAGITSPSESKKGGRPANVDRDEIRRDYIELRMSQHEIAVKHGISQVTVSRIIRKFGISGEDRRAPEFKFKNADEILKDYESGMTQSEIAEKYGSYQGVVCKSMKRLGIKARKRGNHKKGDKNNGWKGGKHTSRGYVYIYYPDHPNATIGRVYIAEHVLVMSQHLGRPLTKEEVVHHIDLIKDNNTIDNLALTNNFTHKTWHHLLGYVGASFFMSGEISFDPELGYRRTEGEPTPRPAKLDKPIKRGRRRSNLGYIYLYMPDYEYSDSQGYVAEHALLVEQNTGRFPSKSEVIHHIDLDKTNNVIDNLILTDRSHHREWHHQLELLAAEFFREGKIGFNPEVGYFRI